MLVVGVQTGHPSTAAVNSLDSVAACVVDLGVPVLKTGRANPSSFGPPFQSVSDAVQNGHSCTTTPTNKQKPAVAKAKKAAPQKKPVAAKVKKAAPSKKVCAVLCRVVDDVSCG